MPLVANQHPTAVYRQHHHHHGRVACEGRRVVAPPCPRSTARFQPEVSSGTGGIVSQLVEYTAAECTQNRKGKQHRYDR